MNIVKVERFLVMPLVLPMTQPTLQIPGTRPVLQQQQMIGGALKWSVPEWDKAGYERIQKAVDAFGSKVKGMEISDFANKLAEEVARLLPDREFSVNIGSFIIEYKPVKKEVKK